MGASFHWAVCPAFEMNDERKAKLEELVRTLDIREFDECGQFGCEEEDPPEQERRDQILASVIEATEPSREVGTIELPGMDYACWITGGLSWGETPTDSFDAIEIAGTGPLWDQLLVWSKEDYAAVQQRLAETEKAIRKPRFNSAYEVAFSIDHDEEDPASVPVSQLIAALEKRVAELKRMSEDEASEAMEPYDTYENPVGGL